MEKIETDSKTYFDTEKKTVIELVNFALDTAKKKGATEAEVAVTLDKGLSASVRLGEIETVEFNRDKGFGITVYIGKKRGSASTSDTSKEAIVAAVEASCDIATVTGEDNCFGLAEKTLLADPYPDLALFHPWSISAQEAIDIALQCENTARNLDKRITNSEGASASSYDFFRAYGNSFGFYGDYQSSRHSIHCVLVADDNKGMQRDYDYTTARNPAFLEKIETVAKRAVNKTIKRLNPQKLSTRKVPVIFAADVSSSLLGAFISAISGSNIYRRSSFLVDQLEKKLFPTRFNIYEQPHLKSALGSAPFDSEGLLTRNNYFLKEGILKSYVLSSYSARRLGLETTANAGGVHNLTINDDGLDFNALLKKMDKGFVVTELMGQGSNLVTGDYSRGAAGFWVEDGCIAYPVDEVTIAGKLQDMFKNIVAVGNDIDIRRATRCGSILIEQMTIGGA